MSGGSLRLLHHIGGVDEKSAAHLLHLERSVKVIHPFSDDRMQENLLVELGPGHLDCLRVRDNVADLFRLVVVHLDEPPQLIRDIHFCKPSKIESTKLSPPACKLASKLRAHTKCSHAPCGGA